MWVYNKILQFGVSYSDRLYISSNGESGPQMSLNISMYDGSHTLKVNIFAERDHRRRHCKELAESFGVKRRNGTMEKGKRRGIRRGMDERNEPSFFLFPFCWFAHRGTHPEHLSRASCDTQVASVQNAPISKLSPFLHWHPSLYVSPEHGYWLMQAGDAGHSWAWL